MRHLFLLSILAMLCGCIQGPGQGIDEAISQCDLKNDSRFRDICVIEAAESAKDLSICTRVIEPRYREVCVGRVAVKRGEPELCEKMADKKLVGECKVAAQQS